MNGILTVAEIKTIDTMAQSMRDPTRRTRARLVQHALNQADEAGDDGYLYRRQAWRLARGLV